MGEYAIYDFQSFYSSSANSVIAFDCALIGVLILIPRNIPLIDCLGTLFIVRPGIEEFETRRGP